MKFVQKFIVVLAVLLSFEGFSLALDLDGLVISDFAVAGNKNLVLNGHGFRKKFFVKVYLGALYLEQKTHSSEEIINMEAKSIKMHFVYKKVGKDKLKEAFEEGFNKNGADPKSDVAKAFLDAINFDVVSGDELNINFDKENVQVLHNTDEVFKTASKELSVALIKVFIGENPADEGLKKGMLGN